MARLLEKYRKEIIPEMQKKFSYKNPLAVPRLEKIVINSGVGKAIENRKRLEQAVKDITFVSGQKPIITKAKHSIAGFKLREGQEIGCMVTLRGKRMYEFFDRLISMAIPRIRDFRGFSKNSFDGRGNYSLGIAEQSVFPEVNLDEMEFFQGMNITITIKRGTDETSYELLRLFGFPFKREE